MTEGIASAIGAYVPPTVAALDGAAPDGELVTALRQVTGLSSAFSDELDRLGLRATVSASAVSPLRGGDVAVGRAATLRYLPVRQAGEAAGRLAHLTLFATAGPGDVAVITAPPAIDASVLGGRAAAAAREAGLAGIVAHGAIRDVDEILDTGLPVWASARTSVTGRGRLEAVEINGPAEVGGVQVVAGDIVVADASGIAFVPAALFDELARRVLQSWPSELPPGRFAPGR